MCVGTQGNCYTSDYNADWAVQFDVTVDPAETGQLTSLEFYEKSSG